MEVKQKQIMSKISKIYDNIVAARLALVRLLRKQIDAERFASIMKELGAAERWIERGLEVKRLAERYARGRISPDELEEKMEEMSLEHGLRSEVREAKARRRARQLRRSEELRRRAGRK